MTLAWSLLVALSVCGRAAERSAPAAPAAGLPSLPSSAVSAPGLPGGSAASPPARAEAFSAPKDALAAPSLTGSARSIDAAAAQAAAPQAAETVERLFQELRQGEKPAEGALKAAFDGAPESDPFASRFLPRVGSNGVLNLGRLRARAPKGFKRKKALKKHAKSVGKIDKLEKAMFADKKRRVLVVVHGPNAGGKDGTGHDVFSGDPQIVHGTSFKKPGADEVKQHYLARILKALPFGKGLVTLFNRSHYEDLIVPAVAPEKYAKIWGSVPDEAGLAARVAEINAMEKKLAEEGWVILKFYLHITKDEQYRRLRDRQVTPRKNWKLSTEDLEEHEQNWVPTRQANGRYIAATDTPWARWFVIPANDKWYRNYVIARIVRRALKSLDLRYPPAPDGLDKVKIKR